MNLGVDSFLKRVTLGDSTQKMAKESTPATPTLGIPTALVEAMRAKQNEVTKMTILKEL